MIGPLLVPALALIVLTAVVVWGLLRRQSMGPTTDDARVAAAEARVEELRAQLDADRQGFSGLRAKLEDSERARAAAETRVAEMEKRAAAQHEAEGALKNAFEALAAEALAKNNRAFLTLADEKFKALKEGAGAELTSRQEAINRLVAPLITALDRYKSDVNTVSDRLASLEGTELSLQRETAKLVNALRSPQVRGRWGEIALRRTAELAGMSVHCDFVEQESMTTDEGRLRPDMVVKLPAGREVVVDSKVSLSAYLEALEADTDEAREAALTRHAGQISQHVLKLSSKEYWEQFPSAPEFVVLFIPNDSFLAAAADRDPDLIESALMRKIVIATPTTFVALLRAIAYGWRQELLTENAQRISALGQDLADRIATFVEHLNGVGGSLDKAVRSFNASVASFESRVLVSARKFKELGASGKKEIEELAPVDQMPRMLTIAQEDGHD